MKKVIQIHTSPLENNGGSSKVAVTMLFEDGSVRTDIVSSCGSTQGSIHHTGTGGG